MTQELLDGIVQKRKEQIQNRQLFISCVVPVYNEQEVVQIFLQTLITALKQLTDVYEVIVVDDASRDETVSRVMPFLGEGVKLLSFSRNFRKENALTAGIDHANGEVVILIDADLQHPVSMISQFVQEWSNGYDMVYGVRTNRDSESWSKRLAARLFYRLMAHMTNISIPDGAGDFRLLDRCVVDALKQMGERSRFMKGLYSWVGFRSKEIPYEVAKRAGGTSTYNMRRLTELAITGITSFSDIPLRVWSFLGVMISLFALLYALYVVISTEIFGVDVPGFATIIVSVMFFGGIQLLSIGVLGEYLSRIFNEVKHRPNYIISKKFGFSEKDTSFKG